MRNEYLNSGGLAPELSHLSLYAANGSPSQTPFTQVGKATAEQRQENALSVRDHIEHHWVWPWGLHHNHLPKEEQGHI